LRPVHTASRKIFNVDLFDMALDVIAGETTPEDLVEIDVEYENFLTEVREFTGNGNVDDTARAFSESLKIQPDLLHRAVLKRFPETVIDRT